jgi:hypothetical protein
MFSKRLRLHCGLKGLANAWKRPGKVGDGVISQICQKSKGDNPASQLLGGGTKGG